MQVVKPNLNWAIDPTHPLNLNAVDGIALHHMAHPTWTIHDVHNSHMGRGWGGIGYNYWVGFDGTVYEGRGFNWGIGIADHNNHLIHIGFQGNYEPFNPNVDYQTEMPDAQFNAGVRLIRWLREKVPSVRVVHGHKYWQANACPGRYFPLTEMVAGKERGIVEKPKFSDIEGHWAADYIKTVTDAGLMKGYGDGTFQPDKPLTRAEAATVLNHVLYILNQKG